MALTIAQNHTFREYGFGSATVRFVVSNDYSCLFDEEADWTTDVVLLDSVAQDLETDDLAFAVDELQFSVDSAACFTDEQQKTLFFLLAAADTSKSRFVAVFMNPTYTSGVADIDTLLFIGKMDAAIAADDHAWQGARYDPDVQAVSVWKFTAKSFDVKMFDEIKVAELFDGYRAPGNTTETPDVAGIDTAAIDALFDDKPYYGAYDASSVAQYQGKIVALLSDTGNLYDVLQLIADKAAEIIAEKNGIGGFTAEVLESDLGFGAVPANVALLAPLAGAYLHVHSFTLRNSVTNVVLSSDSMKTVWIHKNMVVPATITDPGIDERPLSFRQYSTFSDLLFGVARSFGCFLRVKYVTADHITLQFISRSSFLDEDEVHLRDADKSALNIAPADSSRGELFRGRTSMYSLDGLDHFTDFFEYRAPSDSKRMEAAAKDKTGRRTPLLFSTGITAVSTYHLGIYVDGSLWPSHSYLQNTAVHIRTGPLAPAYGSGGVHRQLLRTGIYVKVSHTSPETADDYRGTFAESWRDVVHIVANLDGVPTAFNTLSEYVNAALARDGDFYQSELSLTVPFWNGFAADDAGTDATWKRCKLGARYSRTEHIRTLNETTNEWDTDERADAYSIVGIKWKLTEPSVELKLHRLSRFAFTEYTGDPSAIVLPDAETPVLTSGDGETNTGTGTGYEDLVSATVVSVRDDGLLVASLPTFWHYRRIIGVTMTSADAGNPVVVKTGGRIGYPGWSFTPGKPVFLRDDGEGQLLTQTPLTEPGEGETMFVKLGTADSVISFIWDVEQYTFYGAEG